MYQYLRTTPDDRAEPREGVAIERFSRFSSNPHNYALPITSHARWGIVGMPGCSRGTEEQGQFGCGESTTALTIRSSHRAVVAVRVLLTEDVAWYVPGRNAIAGDYRHTDAVLAYFTRRREPVKRTFRMHLRDLLVGDGGEVAVVTDGTAVIGGVERRWSTVGLYRIRQEGIAASWLLPLDAEALDAIWAAP